MSYESKKLRRLIDEGGYNIEAERFESKYLIDHEERLLRAFAEKYKHTPILKGAYSKCENVGLISTHDKHKYNNIYVFTLINGATCIGLSWMTNNWLQLKGLKLFPHQGFPYILSAFGVLLITFGYSFKMSNALDRKYTPVWQKSKGTLNKNS